MHHVWRIRVRVLFRRIPTETATRRVLAHTRIQNIVGEENILL